MIDIEPATGLVCLEEEDFSLNGENPFFFKRRYNNFSNYQGPFGAAWMYPFDVHLAVRGGELVLLDGEARPVELTGLTQQHRVELDAEDLIAENLESGFLLHQDQGKTLTFSKTPLPDGRLPLVRIDQTDENSIYLSYCDGRLDEILTSSFHRLRLQYGGRYVERISLRTQDGSDDFTLATYEYNPNGQLTAVYDAQNRSRTYEYSGGLLTRYSNRMGGAVYLEHDQQRRATTVWQDGLSRYRKVRYDDVRRTRLVTNSLGYSALLRFNENNLLVETTLCDSSRIERAYGNGNEPIAVTGTAPTPFYSFDPDSNDVEEMNPDGSKRRFQFDDRNRIVEETDPDGGVTRYEYDERNRITRLTDPMGGVNILEFNENGNLIRHQQPIGNTVRAIRSGIGRLELEDSQGPLYVAEHDSFGNPTRITAPSGRTTVYEHDPFGRLTRLAINGHAARKWYDANGHLIAESDLAGNRIEYERDLFGLLTSWTNPVGRRFEYFYDAERRLIGGRSSDGFESRYDYHPTGRLIHMKLRDGREESFIYDENCRKSAVSRESRSGSHLTRYNYTPGGQLSEIETPDGSARYDYDVIGNLVVSECDDHAVKRKWAPGKLLVKEEQDGFQIEYEHNVAGLVTLRKDSSGRVTRYHYDVRGKLAEVSDSLFGVFEIRRDRSGALVRQSLPTGHNRLFEYGADDEISRVVTLNAAGQNVCERAYRHSPTGEMTEAQTAGAERLRFRYDPEHQLAGVAGEGQESEEFAHDLDHNIVRDSRLGKYKYEDGRLVQAGDISFRYDDSGRVVEKRRGEQTTRFRYSLGGLLREAILPNGDQYRYEYDGLGRRVKKIGPKCTIHYYWDQNVLLREERETAQGKCVISYLFVPDTFFPLAHAVDGTCFYYELDRRSCIREVYDAQGATVARFAYRAYGERRNLELTNAQADPPFRLLGQTWDPETGLHCNRFRYYDADVGRFLSPDRFLHQVEHNSYSFSPNPINWADPFGLMAAFNYADSLKLVEEAAAKNGGWYECAECGFRNKNRVYATTAETGKAVGDGCFQGGHIVADANNGNPDPTKNGQVEGGTCNCSKGKRDKPGMTCMDKYGDIHDSDQTRPPETKAQRKEGRKRAKKAQKKRERLELIKQRAAALAAAK
jgi:RHS repeat-associated protein